MKTQFLLAAALLASTACAQPGPYFTLSSGTATFGSQATNGQTKRRDAVGAGFALNGVFAVEASYFWVQEARDAAEDLAGPGFHNPDFFPVASGMKLCGYAYGPVLRWKVSDRVTLFTKQSAVTIKADETDWFNTGSATHWSYTVRAYQPSLGIDLRLSQRAPVRLGLEVSRALTKNYPVKNLTCVGLNLSYGF